jgi:DNA-binding NarL/FixJ family response regulator
LADDHAIVRDGLKAIFQLHESLEVVGEAADGRAALHGIRQRMPDLVIMDIAMPGLDGVEVTRVLRSEGFAGRVLILSMHSTSEHVYQAFDAGADGFLVKESAGGELLGAIERVRRNQRFVSRCIPPEVMAGYLEQQAKGRSSGPLSRLSAREREVLHLVVGGKTSAEIAGILALSPKTVETYRARLMEKLGVGSMVELVRFAVAHGLTRGS